MTKCNSPPINGQCTNFMLFGLALQLPLDFKELTLDLSQEHMYANISFLIS